MQRNKEKKEGKSMNRKEFLEKLENKQGENLIIEVANETIQKVTIPKFKYEIKEDKLYIQSNKELDLAVINLNNIRNIEENLENIILFLEDKKETTIKITFCDF